MTTDQQRPLSPHLQVYRPQLTSVLSIVHRLTGIVLSLGGILVAAWLLALAAGPEPYAAINAWLAAPLPLVLLVAWSAALFYHLLNGIRHLCWDAGWLLELPATYASGWAVVAGTVVLTLLAWGVWT